MEKGVVLLKPIRGDFMEEYDLESKEDRVTFLSLAY